MKSLRIKRFTSTILDVFLSQLGRWPAMQLDFQQRKIISVKEKYFDDDKRAGQGIDLKCLILVHPW